MLNNHPCPDQVNVLVPPARQVQRVQRVRKIKVEERRRGIQQRQSPLGRLTGPIPSLSNLPVQSRRRLLNVVRYRRSLARTSAGLALCVSFVFDPLIIVLTYMASKDLPGNGQYYAVVAQLVFMAWTKVIKLIGLFIREPTDIIFLPISVLFGYFHGGIKLWALFTLRMTSWGSRADGDTNDSQRMTPRVRRSESITLPPGNHPGLIRYKDDKSYVPVVEKSVDADFDPKSEAEIRLSYDLNDSNESDSNSE